MYGLIKLANDTESGPWGDAALAAGGGGLTVSAKDRLLGRKTLFHGTTADNAAAIKREGFKLSDGLGGASESVADAAYMENSKGKIHLSPQRFIANGFGAIASDPAVRDLGRESKSLKSQLELLHSEKVPLSELTDHLDKRFDLEDRLDAVHGQLADRSGNHILQGVVRSPKRVGGETLKVSVPYGEYKAMEVDPDIAQGLNPWAARQLAVRTDTPPESKYIQGAVDDLGRVGRLKESLRLMPDYIKAHPGRFASGVGLAGTGLGAAGLATHNLMRDEG